MGVGVSFGVDVIDELEVEEELDEGVVVLEELDGVVVDDEVVLDELDGVVVLEELDGVVVEDDVVLEELDGVVVDDVETEGVGVREVVEDCDVVEVELDDVDDVVEV